MSDDFDMIAAMKEAEANKKEPIEETKPKSKYSPFDFIKAASETKKDLITSDDYPSDIEKMYTPYVVNMGFSYFTDTILHANEMNMKHWLFKDAQYRYYLGALRPRDRRSTWFKPSKDIALDNIQEYYQCNRTVAKQYAKVLTKENIELINTKVSKGGV